MEECNLLSQSKKKQGAFVHPGEKKRKTSSIYLLKRSILSTKKKGLNWGSLIVLLSSHAMNNLAIPSVHTLPMATPLIW